MQFGTVRIPQFSIVFKKNRISISLSLWTPISALGETDVSGLTLNATQNQLSIDFVGLGFAAGEALRYQYRLAGADPDWSAPTDQRTINYAGLSAGSYRFMVRAVTADGSISPAPATINFIIMPPF